MAKRKTKQKQVNVRFDQKLVLFEWMLKLFEVQDFYTFSRSLKDERFEGFDEEGHSFYYYNLKSLVGRISLSNEQLLEYDENIVRHWKQITEKRIHLEGRNLNPKYFQYLSLIFTEIYLDRYFSNKQKLLSDLNSFLLEFNNKYPEINLNIESFTIESLNKIAFWSATGSGKTLLMHVNLLQYKHYLKKHNVAKDLNRIILLTPNEGLSRQHYEEFELSGISAELFSGESLNLFQGKNIEILDIHKLRDEKGAKTFAVESFEGNNLVLVDEGHRGMSGAEIGQWMTKRDKLCEDGFSFEYSATFGQALKASGSRELEQKYAKCILFDYSYKWFYGDGYGKQYRILNLDDDSDEMIRKKYLIAGLLAFFQQQKLFQDKKTEYLPFLLEKPLWVFVGGKVNAVRKIGGRDVSDVVDILLFIAEFVGQKENSIAILKGFLSGQSGLTDSQGRDLFVHAFPYLIKKQYNETELFSDILKTVFNTTSISALHVENLKGASGELALSFGENDPFGVINVGDESALLKLCEQQSELVVGDSEFSDSLFHNINKSDSTVNILIGSKKFSEGWNSWRVSTMGLMNMAKSEGAQVIQLFGRGVRLKGKDFCLKRTDAILGIAKPVHIDQIETLQIFGVRADYMKQFREYLEEEGLPTNDDRVEIILPVVNNLGKQKLKIIRLKEGLDFKRNGPKPDLSDLSGAHDVGRIVVDWYPKIKALQSKDLRPNEELEKTEVSFCGDHLAFMDFDYIYFELQQMKRERTYYNLNISKYDLIKLFESNSWYTLYASQDIMNFDDYISFSRITLWQDMVIALLKKFSDRYYKVKKAEWENEHLEYKELSPSDPNFFDEYQLMIDRSCEEIIERITQIKNEMSKGVFHAVEFQGFRVFQFDKHLYSPLISVNSEYIDVKPVSLNEGEREFVLDLKSFCETNKNYFNDGRELYLLRNMSKGRGTGFFEAGNFYPDFILWILHDNKQYINFVDPKGVRNLSGIHDPKIEFYRTIKQLETKLADPVVSLNSFIISNTLYDEISWWDHKLKKSDFEKRHVFFQNDDKDVYINKLLFSII